MPHRAAAGGRLINIAVKRLHAFISGRVQGVWFRDFIRINAQHLCVTGWVRNLSSGEVEVTAEGENDALHRLARLLQEGPSLAHVEDVTIEYLPASGEYADFRIV